MGTPYTNTPPTRRAAPAPEDARRGPVARTDDGPLFDAPAQPAAPALEPASALPARVYPKRSATVRVSYHGLPIELTLTDTRIDEIEQLVDGLLNREGWSAPAAQPGATPARPPRPAELEQLPLYRPDGTACCPIHKKPLKQGQHGPYCSAKAEAPIGNEKGYCRYTYKDE